jgi:hypothetical protein
LRFAWRLWDWCAGGLTAKKEEPKEPQPPVAIPFDVKAYVAEEVVKQAASYPQYEANRACEKCHASAPANPPRDSFSMGYLIGPHEIEQKNFTANFKYQLEVSSRSYWGYGYPSKYAPDSHHASGPGHIDRTCSRCGFSWTELAVDEKAAA